MPAVAAGAMGIGGECDAQDTESKPPRGPAHGGRILEERGQEKSPRPGGIRLPSPYPMVRGVFTALSTAASSFSWVIGFVR